MHAGKGHGGEADLDALSKFPAIRANLKRQFNADLAVVVNLNTPVEPGRQGVEKLKKIDDLYQGRVLNCLSDYQIADGLQFPPEELPWWMERGIVGYKIWADDEAMVKGANPLFKLPWYDIDDPANDPTFTKMEQVGMVGVGVHIVDPYGSYGKRTEWIQDPVQFWTGIHHWEKVLEKHPKLVVINAHMLWLCNSDEQLDYLGYIFETFPNVYVDTAAVISFLAHVNRDYLRAFMIKYADRIVFATDTDFQITDENSAVRSYWENFRYYETDQIFPANPAKKELEYQGLALPPEVLKKLYYQNAMRLLPRVREVLTSLGYTVETGVVASGQGKIGTMVPFAFAVGSKSLPVGNYDFYGGKGDLSANMLHDFSGAADDVTLYIFGGSVGMSATASVIARLPAAGIPKSPKDAHVVFDKIGDKYILSEVWIPGFDGFVLASTKEKHERRILDVPVR